MSWRSCSTTPTSWRRRGASCSPCWPSSRTTARPWTCWRRLPERLYAGGARCERRVDRPVVRVDLSAPHVTDPLLANLRTLTRVQELSLQDTHITDAGLVNLRGLTRLEVLSLQGTRVRDAGLAELEGLTRLTWL